MAKFRSRFPVNFPVGKGKGGSATRGPGVGHCEECVFEGNADHEVLVTTGGDPVIRRNEFRDGANRCAGGKGSSIPSEIHNPIALEFSRVGKRSLARSQQDGSEH